MRRIAKITRRCEHCHGTGVVAIGDVYAETYRGLKRFSRGGGYCVANRDCEAFGCKGPTLSMRLTRLQQMGLATSVIKGRERRFRAT